MPIQTLKPSNTPHIAVQNLSLSLNTGRSIVTDLSLTISAGVKLAIIGAEGAGKTTLMQFFADELNLNNYTVSGHIQRSRLGYLAQLPNLKWLNQTPLAFMLQEKPDQKLNQDDMHLWGNYDAALQAIIKLGFSQEFLHRDCRTENLSGGEYMRLRLAKLIMHQPDVILLDEPTNNLDLASIRWLENFIQNSECGIGFISHDESLIENVSNQILYMQYIKNPGNRARHIYVGTSYQEFLDFNEKLISESEHEKDLVNKKQCILKKQLGSV